MFKTIIVGFDGSEHSENALRVACDLTHKYAADLHLVHTPQPQTTAFALGAVAGYQELPTLPRMEEIEAAAQETVKIAKAIAAEKDCRFASVNTDPGDPAKEITKLAQDIDANLIVTGRRGLGAVGALVQGSTSLAINRMATCACLSVE